MRALGGVLILLGAAGAVVCVAAGGGRFSWPVGVALAAVLTAGLVALGLAGRR